VQIMSAEIVL